MNTWIVVKINAQRANAKVHEAIFGVPSPSAAWGFAKALALRTNYNLIDGVAYIIRDYEPIARRTFMGEHQFALQRSANRDVEGATQVDLPRCNLAVTLIFPLEVPEGAAVLDSITQAIAAMRFAGGVIAEHKVKIYASKDEAIKHVGVGFTPFLLKEPIPTPEDLRKCVRPQETPTDDSGWRTPTSIGHRLIENPRKRAGARQRLLHAYTDPIIAVLAWESIRRHVRGANNHQLTFWKPFWIDSNTVIFCDPTI